MIRIISFSIYPNSVLAHFQSIYWQIPFTTESVIKSNFQWNIIFRCHHWRSVVAEKIKRISANYIADQEESSGYFQEYFFQNLSDIHLKSDLRGEWEPNSKEAYVYIFSVIGIFILLIACINFMNLATARSAKRAKEIAVRKVSGAARQQLSTSACLLSST